MREFLLHSIPFIVLGAMALSIYYLSARKVQVLGPPMRLGTHSELTIINLK
ncbi:MAG: hypothetical protein R3Y39_08435 [Rikenellaceae bacterium]